MLSSNASIGGSACGVGADVLDEIDSLVVVLIELVHNRPSLDYDHLTFVSYHLGFQWCNDLDHCYLAIYGFLNDLQHKLVNLCVSIVPQFSAKRRYNTIRCHSVTSRRSPRVFICPAFYLLPR